MRLSTKTLLASATSLLLAGSALAGASLDTLLNGEILYSDNGELQFSDFQYTPALNAPEASDIEVLVLEDGLLFQTDILADQTTGEVAFDLAYKVTGETSAIENVYMQSKGYVSGNGEAELEKMFDDMIGQEVVSLSNYFGNAKIESSFTSANFAPNSFINVQDSIFVNPGTGTAEISEFSQTFGTASAVPSPTAALAGVALLGVIGLRRRRG